MNVLKANSRASLLIALLIVLNGILLWQWCATDTRPLAGEPALQTLDAIETLDGSHKISFFKSPPLVRWLVGWSTHLVRDVADAGALVNFFFLAGLILVVFRIGHRLMGETEGLVAAFLVSSFPAVIELSRSALADLTLTFWVGLTVLCLLMIVETPTLFWQVGLGISLGFSLLTRGSALIYIVGPLVWAQIKMVKNKTWRRLGTPLAIAAFIALPWYLPHMIPLLLTKESGQMIGASGLMASWFGSIVWYPISWGESLNFYFYLLFLLGGVVVFWQKKHGLILLWLTVPFLFLLLMPDKKSPDILPVIPAMAILSVAWIPSHRRTILGAVFLGAVLNSGFYHFGRFLPIAVPLGPVSFVIWRNQPPEFADWKHADIIRRIQEKKLTSPQFVKVVVLSDNPYFHATTLNVSARKAGDADIYFSGPSGDRWLDMVEFVLYKTNEGRSSPFTSDIQSAVEWMTHPPAWFLNSYQEEDRWSLPDGSEAVLVQVHPKPFPFMEVEGFGLSLKTYQLPHIKIEGLELRSSPSSLSDTRVGKMKALFVRCSKLIYKGIVFENVVIRFMEPQINVRRLFATGEVQLMRVKSIEAKGRLSTPSLMEWIQNRATWLKDPRIVFVGDRIDLEGRMGFVPFFVETSIQREDNILQTRLEKVRIGGIRIPKFLFSALVNRSIPLTPGPRWPFFLDLHGWNGMGNAVEVGYQ